MMEAFVQHCGVAAPLLRDNVNTDAIIPSREMKRVSKSGLGEGLFADWRYLQSSAAHTDGISERQLDPAFVLNQPAYSGASILLGGANFGCGSSREHAVWALREYGIRAVIAPGFGSIFANNCVRNGLLPVVLDAAAVFGIADWVQADPEQHLPLIDLPQQCVVIAQGEKGERVYDFQIDAGAKRMLVEGLDAIALTQESWPEIEAFHQRRKENYPWLYR